MSESNSVPSVGISERVHAVIRQVLALEEGPQGRSRLKEDLGADSVDAVMLVMALEREFQGRISDDEYVGLSTVDDVVALVARHAKEQGLA